MAYRATRPWLTRQDMRRGLALGTKIEKWNQLPGEATPWLRHVVMAHSVAEFHLLGRGLPQLRAAGAERQALEWLGR